MEAYVPAEARLFEAAGTPEKPSDIDALGRETDGKAYVGAFIPQVP